MPKRRATTQPDTTESEGTSAPSGLRRSTRRKIQAAAIEEHGSRDVARKNPVEKKSNPKSKAVDPEFGNTAENKHDQTKATLKQADSKPYLKTAKLQSSNTTKSAADGTVRSSSEKSYWLMKAEPESRFENGTDVKFSIDDLSSRTEPEPWDGIRNYMARNNLRAMRKGELAFFYHSNCKEPGIMGTMEIVQEHSPDLSAHDPKAPYYDASSNLDNPKWSVVHVQFHSKFVNPIGLKELRDLGKPGQPLENMQLLKQSRLSVSRVSPGEWQYLIDMVNDRGGETG